MAYFDCDGAARTNNYALRDPTERQLHPPLHQHALARTRTATPFSTTTSKWRVYQFHHQSVRLTRPAELVCHTCHASHAQRNRSYGPTVLRSCRPTVLRSYRPTVLRSYRPTVLPSYGPALRGALHQAAGPNRPNYYGSDGARTRDLSSDSRVL